MDEKIVKAIDEVEARQLQTDAQHATGNQCLGRDSESSALTRGDRAEFIALVEAGAKNSNLPVNCTADHF